MVWLAAGLVLLLGVIVLGRYMLNAPPARVAGLMRVVIGLGSLGLGGFLLLRGLIWLALPIMGFGLSWLFWPRARGGEATALEDQRDGEDEAQPMSREEAYAILGVDPGADAEAVRAAHREAIQALPDSQWASGVRRTELNRALEVLLAPPP